MTRNLIFTAMLTAFTSAAIAQPATGPRPAPHRAPASAPSHSPAPSPEDAKKAEAKALYDKGNTHYNLGEYDAAVAAFKQAYAISSAPGLLFNIAQSFRLAKNYEQASHFYQTYLRLKPDALNRADVEARIAEMLAMIEEQKKLGDKAPIGTVPPEGGHSSGAAPGENSTIEKPAVDQRASGTDRDAMASGRKLKLIGLATMGAGGAMLATGFVFGAMAKSAESEVEKLNAGGVWDQDTYDKGQRNNSIAIVSWVVGGAAVATGGALYFLGHNKMKDASVAVIPHATGAYASMGWKF